MLKHASWIHGNALTIEEPNGIIVHRRGNGTELQLAFLPNVTPPGTWCHIAIPTPVIVNDVRLKVEKLFLLFKTGQHAAIDNVHVFDGPFRIAKFDFINGSGSNANRRSGNHSQAIDPVNTITLPEPHEVSFGMSLSFTFRPVALTVTGLGGTDPEGTLLVTTAGADFF